VAYTFAGNVAREGGLNLTSGGFSRCPSLIFFWKKKKSDGLRNAATKAAAKQTKPAFAGYISCEGIGHEGGLRLCCGGFSRCKLITLAQMGKPYTQLYYHLVWATWDREPLISPVWEEELYASLICKSQELKSDVIAVGGVEDHLHLLLESVPSISVSELVGQIKGASSHFVNHAISPLNGFRWQGYYGAFSVSRSHLPKVMSYIAGQKAHHAGGDLWESAETMSIPD